MRSYQCIAALAGLLALSTTAMAGYAHYWDRASYEAAVSGTLTTTDFSGVQIDSPPGYAYFDPYTNNGVRFTSQYGVLVVEEGYSDYGQRSIVWNDSYAMIAYLPENVTSIGVDMYVSPLYAENTLCTAWFSDGTSSSVLAPAKGKSTSSFWGCEATDGLTITHFTSYATSFDQEGGAHATPPTWDWASPGIGAFSYTVVPEPASLILLGLGLTGLLAYAFRKRK